jgi:adenylate cyclase
MGSTTRFNYTMMGDTVNLGSRCESAAKTYGVDSMVTEETYRRTLSESNEIVFRFLDRIVVKGRTQPVGVYEILGQKKQLPDSVFECLDHFEKGIRRYLDRDWEGAKTFFERSAPLEPLQPSLNKEEGILINPSLLFQSRCQYLAENPPPEDWDGICVMKTK